jgi:hypothetical protein
VRWHERALAPGCERRALGTSGNLRDTVENFANVADNLREGSKVFPNPSGTGPAMNQSETFKHFLDLAIGAVAGHGLHAGLGRLVTSESLKSYREIAPNELQRAS